MGNPLTLAVEMTLDSEKAKEAIEGFKGTVESALTALRGNFSSLTSAVEGSAGALGIAAGAVGALGAGMFELSAHAAEVGTQIYEAGEKTGFAADKLSGLMAITKETGGSFEGLTLGLSRAGVNLEKTIEHAGKLNPLLYQIMGGAQGAAELGLKPMDERLQEVLKRIFEINDVGQQHVALQELMGRGWMQNVEALRLLGEQGYGKAIEMAKQFGVYFDAEAATRARQFTLEWNRLKAEFSSLALVLGEQLIPAITQVMVSFTGWIPTVESWYHSFLGFTKQFIVFGDYQAEYKKASDLSAEATKKMTDEFLNLQNVTRETEAEHKKFTDVLGENDISSAKAAKAAEELAKRNEEWTIQQGKLIEHIEKLTTHGQGLDLLEKQTVSLGQALINVGLAGADAEAKMQKWLDLGTAADHYRVTLEKIPPVIQQLSQATTTQTAAEIAQLPNTVKLDEAYKHLEQSAATQSLSHRQLQHSWEQLAASAAQSMQQMIASGATWADQMVQHDARVMESATQRAVAEKNAADAASKSFEQEVISKVASIVGMVAGMRAAAAVQAVYSLAQAYEQYAIWAASYYTDEAALHAAIMYGLSAVQYGLVAGGVGGGGGGGAGATAPRAAVTAAGGGPTGPSGAGGPGGSYAASGPTTHFNFYGGVISADTLTQFTAQLNQAVRGGQVTLVSSNALTTGPKMT
jgi:hypothetical protein